MGLELGAACVVGREHVAASEKQVCSTKSAQDQTKPRIVYTAWAHTDGVVRGRLGFADCLKGQGAQG